MAAAATKIVNISMGKGSSILPTRKLQDENARAKKLHTPMAVAANSVGKKY